MNYYEQIQKSIDYIEKNLEEKIDITMAANEAYMSLSNYYRMFFAMVGCSVKEYIRMRRIERPLVLPSSYIILGGISSATFSIGLFC